MSNPAQLHLAMPGPSDACCCRGSVELDRLVAALAPQLARLLRGPSPAAWLDGDRVKIVAKVEHVERRHGGIAARIAVEPLGEAAVLLASPDVEGFRGIRSGARLAVLGRVSLSENLMQLPRAVALAVADTNAAKPRKLDVHLLDMAIAHTKSSVGQNGRATTTDGNGDVP